MSVSMDEERLNELLYKLQKEQNYYLGYPNNHSFCYKSLAPFLNLVINNIGDPFVGNLGLNTCEIEREVILKFANWVNNDDPWGYVTNGSSESNLKALDIAQKKYPDGVVLCSQATHYSIAKACKMLQLKCITIDQQPNGEISYTHLFQVAKSLKRYPLIICANIGTTMTGAIDRISMIEKIMTDQGIENYHLHCDAAHFGGYLPFLGEGGLFDFRNNIHTMSVSGHKFLGSPIPCGIFLTKTSLLNEILHPHIEYTGSPDNTISGSRNGLTPLILYQAFQRWGEVGYKELAQDMFQLRDYAVRKLETISWPCWSNVLSNTVVIRRPDEELVRKWKLAVEEDIAHIITVPGVTEERIDVFVEDLLRSHNLDKAV